MFGFGNLIKCKQSKIQLYSIMYETPMITSSDISSENGSCSSSDVTYSSIPSAPNLHLMQQACFLRIIEEPQEKFRYRYKSEKGSHGGLTGISHKKNKKTYPTVKLENYSEGGSVYVIASVFTSDKQHKHVHELRGNGCEGGESKVFVDKDMIAKFTNISIQYTTKEDRCKILTARNTKKKNSELIQKEKEEIENLIKQMNMNCVTLGFQAFVKGHREPLCSMIFSQPICNQKSLDTGDLKIVRISKVSGSRAGNEEVYLLCEKVKKENIKVRFFDTAGWEDFGTFSVADVHHQVAIVFRTPAYTGKSTDEHVEVYMELCRTTDNARSESRKFTYKSDDTDSVMISHNRKRKKLMDDSEMLAKSSNALQYHPISNINEDNNYSSINYDNDAQSMETNTLPDDIASLVNMLNLPEDVRHPNYIDYTDNSIPDISELLNFNDQEVKADGIQGEMGNEVRLRPVFPIQDLSEAEVAHADAQGESYLKQLIDRPLPDLDEGDSIPILIIEGEGSMMDCLPPGFIHTSSPSNTIINLGILSRLGNYIASLFYELACDFVRSSYNRISLLIYNALDFFRRSRDTYSDNLEGEVDKAATRELKNIISFITDYVHILLTMDNNKGKSLVHVLTSSQGDNSKFIEILLRLTLRLLTHNDLQLQTPIHLAIVLDNTSILKYLLEKIVEKNFKSYIGNDLLNIAVKNNSVKCLILIIKNRREFGIYSLDIPNSNGLTPLHIAVKNKCVATSQLLIKGGANINYPAGCSGKTALHFAVIGNSHELVKFLLEQPRINIDVKDCLENTALDLSYAKGYINIAEILRNAKVDGHMPKGDSQKYDVDQSNLAADFSNLSCDDKISRSALDCSAPSKNQEIVRIKKEDCKETGSGQWIDVECEKKICSHLDPPNEGWREFGLFVVDEKDLDSIKLMFDSPTKQLLKLFQKNGGNVDGLKDILQLTESSCLKEVFKVIESSC